MTVTCLLHDCYIDRQEGECDVGQHMVGEEEASDEEGDVPQTPRRIVSSRGVAVLRRSDGREELVMLPPEVDREIVSPEVERAASAQGEPGVEGVEGAPKGRSRILSMVGEEEARRRPGGGTGGTRWRQGG